MVSGAPTVAADQPERHGLRRTQIPSRLQAGKLPGLQSTIASDGSSRITLQHGCRPQRRRNEGGQAAHSEQADPKRSNKRKATYSRKQCRRSCERADGAQRGGEGAGRCRRRLQHGGRALTPGRVNADQQRVSSLSCWSA